MHPYQIVRSKMAKISVLTADPELACYVPKSVVFSAETLKEMLRVYNYVYVKPDYGRGGKRVISVASEDSEHYRVHYKAEIMTGKTFEETASYIDRVAAGDRFLIQQGIYLQCVNDLPFDLRVNVQKPYSKWEVTAMIAKLAAPGNAVTNYSSGGTLVDVTETLLAAGYDDVKIQKIIALFIELGEKTASALSKRYPNLRELGLDIALDLNDRPWILEVNTSPQLPRGLHRKFDNYRRIIRRNTYKTIT